MGVFEHPEHRWIDATADYVPVYSPGPLVVLRVIHVSELHAKYMEKWLTTATCLIRLLITVFTMNASDG